MTRAQDQDRPDRGRTRRRHRRPASRRNRRHRRRRQVARRQQGGIARRGAAADRQTPNAAMPRKRGNRTGSGQRGRPAPMAAPADGAAPAANPPAAIRPARFSPPTAKHPPAKSRNGGSNGRDMNPSRIFILRPGRHSLLMVAILLVGILAYRYLPLSALPEVDYPTIQITTLYPGASPEVMTSSVTAPLERQFGPDAGPEPDVVDEFGRRVGRSRCSSASICRSTSPSRKCRPRSTRPARSCRATCRRRRSTARSIRPTRRSSAWR